jgi:uncharacterized protein YegJ (DUF2314 family)
MASNFGVEIPMRTLFAIAAGVAALALAGCSQSKEGANYVGVSASDPGMNAAIEKAKATVGEFVKAFHERRPGTGNFCVKKPYRTPSGGAEHMWIEVSEEAGGVVRGIVTNEAEETREVKVGQDVTLTLSEISDWQYQDGKKLVGGYTIRYFLEKMSPKEREEFLKGQGFEL